MNVITSSSPAIAVRPGQDQRLALFVTAPGGTLKWASFTKQPLDFLGGLDVDFDNPNVVWSDLGGRIFDAPDAVLDASSSGSKMAVFVRQKDLSIYGREFTGTAWGPTWINLPGIGP
jgi:hypothetical protein